MVVVVVVVIVVIVAVVVVVVVVVLLLLVVVVVVPTARAVRLNTDLPTHAFNFGGLATYDWKSCYL